MCAARLLCTCIIINFKVYGIFIMGIPLLSEIHKHLMGLHYTYIYACCQNILEILVPSNINVFLYEYLKFRLKFHITLTFKNYFEALIT